LVYAVSLKSCVSKMPEDNFCDDVCPIKSSGIIPETSVVNYCGMCGGKTTQESGTKYKPKI